MAVTGRGLYAKKIIRMTHIEVLPHLTLYAIVCGICMIEQFEGRSDGGSVNIITLRCPQFFFPF